MFLKTYLGPRSKNKSKSRILLMKDNAVQKKTAKKFKNCRVWRQSLFRFFPRCTSISQCVLLYSRKVNDRGHAIRGPRLFSFTFSPIVLAISSSSSESPTGFM
ncbi:hypothetical protein CEXT_31411 [Caerostris extrusa]|uniref:Uncharacterized protein n=1 Tax=Caerostris extrusa TaxID=172846 RepID=A0AAV4T174_CAEEX|nr:hypothetical protein CEXT_31411 [Caerostris extrusa]